MRGTCQKHFRIYIWKLAGAPSAFNKERIRRYKMQGLPATSNMWRKMSAGSTEEELHLWKLDSFFSIFTPIPRVHLFMKGRRYFLSKRQRATSNYVSQMEFHQTVEEFQEISAALERQHKLKAGVGFEPYYGWRCFHCLPHLPFFHAF